MTEPCHVRALTAEDLPMVRAWRNHPTVRRFMFTRHEITAEEHQAWFAAAARDATRRMLIVTEGEEPIGYVQFSGVAAGGVSDWGFYARPGAPPGTGRRLGRAALDHAFSVLALHKVCGQAMAANAASIAFHERLGFAREGVLRDHKCVDGVYYTLVCFGLLRQEWQPDSSGAQR